MVLLKDRCFWPLGDWLGQRTGRGHAGAILTDDDDDSFLNALTKMTKRVECPGVEVRQGGLTKNLYWLNPAISKVSA